MKILGISASIALLCGPIALAQGVIPAALPDSAAGTPVKVEVNLARRVGAYTPIYAWFGYDEGNYTTASGGRALLRQLHDLSPVPVRIRFHHLLTSGNGVPELKWSSTNVYTEDAQGRPVYDFRLLDGEFDALKAAGVQPMVELGFMPRDLAAALPDRHEPYQVHYPGNTIAGASNNPPKSYAKWGALVQAVVAHLVQRYGRETVRGWYFEVWNEPDIAYWHGSEADYFKLYDFAVAGVRAALPEAKVGGPATTGPSGAHAAAYLQHFLLHVEHDRSAANGGPIPLDFVSFHAKGHPTLKDGHVTMGIHKELADADTGFAIVSHFPRFRKLPILLSEADPEGCAACSSKVNPANNYRNGTMYPAYTAAAFKSLFALADEHAVNLRAMLSWSFEFEGKDYFEGFRSLSTNGIDKPILNFFRMAGLMSGERVEATSTGATPLRELVSAGVKTGSDIDALATVDGAAAAVLLWNYQESDAPAAARPVTLRLSGLPHGVTRTLVTYFRIDDTHSNAYTVWKKMGSPQRPTASQYAELQGHDGLQMLRSPEWMEVSNGSVELQGALPVESVSLVRLSW